jgi:hypothetical protein
LPLQEGHPRSFKVLILSMAPHHIGAGISEKDGSHTAFTDIKIVADFPRKAFGYFESIVGPIGRRLALQDRHRVGHGAGRLRSGRSSAPSPSGRLSVERSFDFLQ